MRLTAAGFTSPLLHACGGGSSTPASVPSAPISDPDSVKWTRDGILEALSRSDGGQSAVSVALFADDRVVWREAYGYANRESGLKTSVDTRLNIGSVSKVFATLAVMILRDRGLLSLEQPLTELLPAFSMRSPEYTQVTVRQLLNHSPGFPGCNYRNVFNFAPIPGYAQDTLEALKLSHLKHDPGELSVYCNDGFTMLELLVAELSGMSYTTFVERELFDPLGMTLSEFPLKPAVEGTFVHPVYEGRTLPQEMVACHASGSILSTPTDLMKLARLFIDGGVFEGRRILSEGALLEMAVDQAAYTRINLPAPSWRWGLGWDCVAQPGMAAGGLLAWKKGGDTEFFHCDFIVLPRARMAAMMVNDNQFVGNRTSLLEGLLLRAAKERAMIAAPPAVLASAVPPLAVTAPDVSAVTGIYASEGPPIQVLAEADGTLTLRFWNGQVWITAERALRLHADGRWWPDGVSDRCFSFDTVQRHRYLSRRALSDNGLYWDEEPKGEWMPQAPVPLPAAWRSRINSRWQGTNDDPESLEGKLKPRIGEISELAGQPDYVMWNNTQLLRVIDDDDAGMVVKIPVLAGRDQVELRTVRSGDEEQLHIGTLVYRRTA